MAEAAWWRKAHPRKLPVPESYTGQFLRPLLEKDQGKAGAETETAVNVDPVAVPGS